MNKLAPAIALALMLASPVGAADTIPSQYLGRWCWFGDMPASEDVTLTLYDRHKCKTAENEMIVQKASIFIAEEAICKLAKSEKDGDRQKLALDCKHVANGNSWVLGLWFQRSGKWLITQDVPSGENQ